MNVMGHSFELVFQLLELVYELNIPCTIFTKYLLTPATEIYGHRYFARVFTLTICTNPSDLPPILLPFGPDQ